MYRRISTHGNFLTEGFVCWPGDFPAKWQGAVARTNKAPRPHAAARVYQNSIPKQIECVLYMRCRGAYHRQLPGAANSGGTSPSWLRRRGRRLADGAPRRAPPRQQSPRGWLGSNRRRRCCRALPALALSRQNMYQTSLQAARPTRVQDKNLEARWILWIVQSTGPRCWRHAIVFAWRSSSPPSFAGTAPQRLSDHHLLRAGSISTDSFAASPHLSSCSLKHPPV